MRPFEKISLFFLTILIFYTDFYQISVREVSNALAILGSLFILFSLIDLYQTRTSLYRLFPVEITILLMFFIWTFLSGLIVTPNLGDFLNQELFIGELTVITIFILNTVIKSEKYENILIKVILFSAVANAINLLINGQSMHAAYNRVTIGNVNANKLALLFSVSMIAVLYFWNKSNKRYLTKLWLIIISTLLFYVIILTESRQSFFAYAFILVFYYLLIGLFNKGNNYIKIIKKTVGVSIIVISLSLVFNYILDFTGLGERITQVNDSYRIEYYRIALDLFIQHPIAGVGINGFRYYNIYHAYSHSTYAELISCTGIIGVILYFTLFIVLLNKCIKLIKYSMDRLIINKAKIYIVLLLVFLLLGTTTILFYNTFFYIWIAIISGFVIRENKKLNH